MASQAILQKEATMEDGNLSISSMGVKTNGRDNGRHGQGHHRRWKCD